jgi:hypothetical protein
MWGNKFIAGWLDRYLAKKAYSGQQTGEPEDPNRPNNLWTPVPGDHGAHGHFDARSMSSSEETWLAEHLKLIGWGVVLAGAIGALWEIGSQWGRSLKKDEVRSELGQGKKLSSAKPKAWESGISKTRRFE